jgi:hypothetical protein
MNQFRSFISQYTSNAAEKVTCHYKERSLTFRIVASRVISLLKFTVGQGFSPYTNILCPATVGTTGEGLYCTLHCDYRIGARELKDTEHFLLRCCHSETHAAGRIESAGGEEGARLSTLLATIRNVKLRSL